MKLFAAVYACSAWMFRTRGSHQALEALNNAQDLTPDRVEPCFGSPCGALYDCEHGPNGCYQFIYHGVCDKMEWGNRPITGGESPQR